MATRNLDRERDIEWNEKMVESHLRKLTANLMRIARGSGKLYEVEAQVMELANELRVHRNLTMHGISPHVIRQALMTASELHAENDDVAERNRARSVVVQGALQFAASELLDQTTPKFAGDSEMFDGVRMWEEWRKKWTGAPGS